MEFDPERDYSLLRRHRRDDCLAPCRARSRDEVVLFEPFYENYGPDTQLCGRARATSNCTPGLDLPPEDLRAAFTPEPKPSF
jgi:aminotransferase